MDAMVSARVPAEIKKQGDAKLKEIGSSTTELINAAYNHLLKYGELPGASSYENPVEPQVKSISGSAAREFMKTWEKRAALDAQGYNGGNFKEMLNQARDDYYARFA